MKISVDPSTYHSQDLGAYDDYYSWEDGTVKIKCECGYSGYVYVNCSSEGILTGDCDKCDEQFEARS